MPLTTSQSPLRVLVVMDPIDEIKPVKDTTLAMLLAAQKRGWELWYAEQRDLWLRDGVAMAVCARLASATTCRTGSRSMRRIRGRWRTSRSS
jgi:glutathione synthase/RimK-type ligase-like ATP-grasp enzyme